MQTVELKYNNQDKVTRYYRLNSRMDMAEKKKPKNLKIDQEK